MADERPGGPGPETGEQARVRLASERTLLAWIRTGLALMGLGFVVARFGLFLREAAAEREVARITPPGASLQIGVGLVGLGILINVVAAWQHHRFVGRLRRGELAPAPRGWLGLTVAGALAVLGAGLIAYLVAVHV